jgi:hypothetical protein
VPADPPRYVEVHQASNRVNADLIKIRLEEAGIPCVTLGDGTAGLLGQAMVPRIMVPAEVAEQRADEIREIIASVEGVAEPSPRAPYLVRVPGGCLSMLLVWLAVVIGVASLLALILPAPPYPPAAVVGLGISLIFAGLGIALLIRDRRRRAADRAPQDEE